MVRAHIFAFRPFLRLVAHSGWPALALLFLLRFPSGVCADMRAAAIADSGSVRYSNPVLFADYSDPTVVRVGDDFYLVSSASPSTR